LIKYIPQLGRLPAKHWANDLWIGVTTHKNPLGQLCVVGAIAFLLVLDRARAEGRPLLRERIAWLYLAMTAYLLWANGRENSRSSTSILSLGVAISAFWFLGRLRTRFEAVGRALTGGLVGLAATALALQLMGSSLQEIVAELMGKDATLSDRSYLWRDVWRIGMMNPFFGTGYGGFWVPELTALLSPEVNNGPMQAHNGYLETFAQLGFVGLGLLLMVILGSLRAAVRSAAADFDLARARLTLLLAVLVINYAEATFPRGTHLWWFLFLIVALSPPAQPVPEPREAEESDPDVGDAGLESGLQPAPQSAVEATVGRSS
jgi:O-antigen ligase